MWREPKIAFVLLRSKAFTDYFCTAHVKVLIWSGSKAPSQAQAQQHAIKLCRSKKKNVNQTPARELNAIEN